MSPLAGVCMVEWAGVVVLLKCLLALDWHSFTLQRFGRSAGMRKLILVAFLMAPLLAIGATPAAACECCPCGCGCGAYYGAPTYVYTYHCGPYTGRPVLALVATLGRPRRGAGALFP